jgi:periplasmic divalent cation tolerance protein
MQSPKLVLTTGGSKAEAQRIARALVERRLAACVNVVGPIESVYRWQDTVENAEEWLLLIKTTAATVAQVSALISELHSYELPECLELPIESGSAAYLKWIEDSVSKPA